ncbi:MAG: hypothetical protein AAFY07_10360 [Pseudomonadota bacterium]
MKILLVLGASVLALSIALSISPAARAQGNWNIARQAGSSNQLTADQSRSGNSSIVDHESTAKALDCIANEATITQGAP